MENKIYKIMIVHTGNYANKSFAPNLKVSEVIAEIQSQQHLSNINIADFGLYVPANVISGAKAYWLAPNSPLKSYPLGEKDVLHFKTRYRVLRYKLVDDTAKSILIDEAATVREIADAICEKLGLQSLSEEFSLRKPIPPGGNTKAVVWLNETSTLNDYDYGPDDEIDFGKRFFAGDGRIDKDDPFALHLLYSEAQKAIVAGHYPCSRAEAVQFAAIQMQVIYGDHQPNIHKPGFLGKAQVPFLPLALRKDQKIEAEILVAHKLLYGIKDLAAKYRYIQTVRGLKTYGITFFEGTIPNPKPGAKAPIPLWIGITRSGIMRVDPATGETVKEWYLEQLRRWASDTDSLTLDFGDHEDDYLVVSTLESVAVGELIGGYIDIILKYRQDTDKVVDDDEDDIANEEIWQGMLGFADYGLTSMGNTPTAFGGFQSQQVGPGQQYSGVIPGNPGTARGEEDASSPLAQHLIGPDAPSNHINVVDMGSSVKALKLLAAELGGKRLPIDTTQLSPEEWGKRFKALQDQIGDKVVDMLKQAQLSPGKLDRQIFDKKAADLTNDIKNLGTCARALVDLDPNNEPLLDGTKALSNTVADLISSILRGVEQGKTGSDMRPTLEAAEKAWEAAKHLLNNPDLANYIDDASELLMMECLKDVEMNLDKMIGSVATASKNVPHPKGGMLLKDAEKAAAIKGFPLGCLQSLIHAALDPSVLSHIGIACNDVSALAGELLQKAKMDGYPQSQLPALAEYYDGVDTALLNLQQAMNMCEPRGPGGPLDIKAPIADVLTALGEMKRSMRNPQKVGEIARTIEPTMNKIFQIQELLGSRLSPEMRNTLLKAANALSESLKQLMMEANRYNNPQNLQAAQKIQGLCGQAEMAAAHLLEEAATVAALHNLRHNTKLATAAAIRLASASCDAGHGIGNAAVRADLLASAKHVQESMANMMAALQGACDQPGDIVANSKLLAVARQEVPFYSQLSSTAKGAATRHIADKVKKHKITKASDEAAGDLMKWNGAIQEVSDLLGETEMEKAMADFDVTKADLQLNAYLIKEGLLEHIPGQSREDSQALMNVQADDMSKAVHDLIGAAKQGHKLPQHVLNCASSIGQVATAARTIATSVPDQDSQKHVIGLAKALLDDTLDLVGLARELALDPRNDIKQQAVERKRRNFDATLGNLRGNTSSLDTTDINSALDAIDKNVGNLTKNSPNLVNYRDASDALDASSKALGMAAIQLQSVAKTNPNLLGPTAQMASTTLGQFLVLCSDAATAAPDDKLANSILATARSLADAMKGLMNSAMLVAGNKTPQTLALMAESAEQLNQCTEELLGSLGNVTSPETDKSLKRIMEALRAIDSSQAYASSRDQLLKEFLACARDMARVTANLVTSAHVSANKQGMYSKEASHLVTDLLAAAKSAELSDGSRPTMSVEAARVCRDADFISRNPNDQEAVAEKVKALPENVTKLVNGAKAFSQAEPNPQKREAVTRAAQTVASAAAAVAAASRTPGPDGGAKLAQSANALKEHVAAMENVMRKDNGNTPCVEPSTARELSGTTKKLALATYEMIKASAVVSSNPSDVTAEKDLKKSTNTVGDSIKRLMDVCATLNPAVKECERAIDVAKEASVDLDKATIAATMGTLEQDVRSNMPFEEAQQAAHKTAQQLARLIDEAASEDSPQQLQNTTHAITSSLPNLIELIKITAATSHDQSMQSKLLNASKQLVDGLGQLFSELKNASPATPQSKERIDRAADRAQAGLAALLGDLQSEQQLQAEMDTALRSMKSSLDTIANPVSSPKAYAHSREEVNTQTKDLVAVLSVLSSVDPKNTGQIIIETGRLTEIVPHLVESVRNCIAATPDQTVKQQQAESVKQVVSNTIRALFDVKKATQGQQTNSQLQQNIAQSNTAIAQLLASIKQGAVGEAMLDKAIQVITQKIASLNTASVFAQAGQLEENDQAKGMSASDFEHQLQMAAGGLSEAAKTMSRAVRGNDEQLGAAANDLSGHLGRVVNIVVALSSKFQDSMAQQEILSAAKFLAISNEQLVLGARDLLKCPDDKTAKASFESSQVSLQENLKNLLATAQEIAGEAARAEAEINKAINGIKALLLNTPGYAHALPVDVAAAAEEVLVSASRVIFSPSKTETAEAAQACFTSVEDLLNTAKRLASTGPDAFIGEQLVSASKSVGQFVVTLLEVTKLNQSDPATQGKFELASGKISQAVHAVIATLRRFPGGQDIKLAGGQNLVALAEAELLACHGIIDEVSKKLSATTPLAKQVKPQFGIVDVSEVAGSILNSSVACTKATSVLVQWSVAALRERVKALQGQNQTVDPMWCQGIIGASQSVADSIQDLFVGASQAAQGKGEEEKLIACANNVASSTSTLVSASKVQALAGSHTQENLNKSAKAVAHSTAKLISAAQMLSMGNLGGEKDGGLNQELEHHIRILELEKQLEKEKNRAKRLKNERPVSVYLQGNRTSVYGLQPAGGKRTSVYGNRESVYGGRASMYGNRASVRMTGGAGLQGLGGTRF